MRFLIFVCLWSTGVHAAEAFAISVTNPVIRPGILWRCTVHGTVDPGPNAGALVLTVSLVAGSLVLAATEVPLSDAHAFRSGVTVALLPSGPLPRAVVPEVRARLAHAFTNGERPVVVRATRVLENPAGLSQQAEAAILALHNVAPSRLNDPLVRLLAEEFAELGMGDQPPTVDAENRRRQVVMSLVAQSAVPQSAVPQSTVPQSTVPQSVFLQSTKSEATALHAFVDPVDGSVQPIRLTMPSVVGDNLPLVMVLRGDGPATPKVFWPTLPASWLSAASTAGVAVCEVYPAGDRTWSGAGRRRIALAEAEIRRIQPAMGPAIIMVAHEGLAQPEAWQVAVPLPPKAVPQGRLAAWAEGPFVIVVGSGEHAAAAADAMYVAREFRAAWANHAQGLPPLVVDSNFRWSDWSGYNLVLSGSPRANSVTAELTLPLTWDDRLITWNGHSYHRSWLPGVAVAMPHPQNARLTVLVLDGAPPWSAIPGELPFAAEGLTADLIIQPGSSTPGPGELPRSVTDDGPVRVLLESSHSRP